MRRLKRPLIGAVVLALVVAGIALAQGVLLRALEQPLAARLSEALGREVRILGDLQLGLGLEPHLTAERVSVGNPAGWHTPEFARIAEVHLKLRLHRLLSGVVDVDEIRLVGLDLHLERDAEGRRNWQISIAKTEGAADGVQTHVHRLRVEDATLHVRGAPGRAWRMELREFTADGLSSDAATELAAEGSLRGARFHLAAHLDPASRADSKARAVTLRGRALGGRLEASGSIADPGRGKGIDGTFTLDFRELRALAKWIGTPLPPIAPLRARGRLRGSAEKLRVADLAVEAGSRDAVWAGATGSVGDLFDFEKVAIDVRFGATDVAHLDSWWGVETRDAGPLEGSARLSDGDGDLGLDSVAIRAGRDPGALLELGGGLDDVRTRKGLEMTLRLSAPDLSALGASFGRELPALGPVTAHGRLVDRSGTPALDDVSFVFGGGAARPVRLEITGGLEDLRGLDSIDVQARLSAGDLAALGAPFDVELPVVGPVEVTGRLIGSNQLVSAQELRARIAHTRMTGDLETSFAPGRRPRLRGALRFPELHLEDLDLAAPRAREPRAPDDPWSWQALRTLDAEVTVRADRVTGRADLDWERLGFELRLEQGHLEIRNLEIADGGASLTGGAHIDASGDAARGSVKLRARDLEVGRAVAQFTEKFVLSGPLDADIDLRSGLGSRRQALRELEGDLLLVVEDGTASSDYTRAFARDLIRAVTSSEWRGDQQTLRCLIGDLAVQGGRASVNTLLLDTPSVAVVGAGQIDLGGDRFDLLLTPHLRDPGMVSVAPRVKVAGSLARPEVHPVTSSLALSALRNLVSGTLRTAIDPLLGALDSLLRAAGAQPFADEGPCAHAIASVRSLAASQ